MRSIIKAFILTLFIVGCSGIKEKNCSNSKKWSVEMADAAMKRFNDLESYNNPKKIKWQYDIAMLGQAIDRLGNVDAKYSRYHEAFLNYFVDNNGSIKHFAKDDYKLDNINPAKGLITLYKRTGDEKYMNAIKRVIEQLQEQPKTISGGFWHKKIYPYQIWLDGLYMSAPFMAQYALEFNENKWFDEVIDQIVLAYHATLDKNTGLLYHAWDESKKQRWSNAETGVSSNFWGRSMGWYLMALVDVLDYIPENYGDRDTVISILQQTSNTLLNYRDDKTGLWYQVLDKGGENGNYLEASCSAMFTYAFAKGAKKGHLNNNYMKIAKNSFEAILETFILDDNDGHISMNNICGAAGLGGNPYRDGSYDYYVNEKIVKNDPKGVAPFIMAAIELDR